MLDHDVFDGFNCSHFPLGLVEPGGQTHRLIQREGGRARPSPNLGSIADKFLFSSHCMSELVGDEEPRCEGEEDSNVYNLTNDEPQRQLLSLQASFRWCGFIMHCQVHDALESHSPSPTIPFPTLGWFERVNRRIAMPGGYVQTE